MHIQLLIGASPLGCPRMDAPQVAHQTIAVDGGVHLEPDIQHITTLIGDMDSIDPAQLQAARSGGVELIQLPSDKDLTDSEAAISLALNRGASSLHVVNGPGDRVDHLFALLQGLETIPEEVDVTAQLGAFWLERITPTHPYRARLPLGSLISLLPTASGAHGISTQGLQWALNNESLVFGQSRGLSNVTTASEIQIRVSEGALHLLFPLQQSTEVS